MLTRKCDDSSPLTAGRQGRRARMALKSILGVMWVTRMTMNKECEDEMIRVREQGKWNGLKQNLELCQCIVIPFLHRTDPTAKCMCVIKGT